MSVSLSPMFESSARHATATLNYVASKMSAVAAIVSGIAATTFGSCIHTATPAVINCSHFLSKFLGGFAFGLSFAIVTVVFSKIFGVNPMVFPYQANAE